MLQQQKMADIFSRCNSTISRLVKRCNETKSQENRSRREMTPSFYQAIVWLASEAFAFEYRSRRVTSLNIRQMWSLQEVRHTFLSLLLFSAMKCAETIITCTAISQCGFYFGTSLCHVIYIYTLSEVFKIKFDFKFCNSCAGASHNVVVTVLM